MDPSIDPCDNFYDFACGGFVKRVFLYPDQTPLTAFSESSSRLNIRFFEILSDNKGTQDEAKPYNLAKALFNGCNNKTLVKSRGLQPLQELVDTFGGWPVVTAGRDQWTGEVWTWQKLLVGYRNVGATWNHFFNLEFIDSMSYNVSKQFKSNLML